VRCAIYCRKSTSEGLDKDFNSIDAQREAFIRSQQSEGWDCLPEKYDDGGFTGTNMDRPALKRETSSPPKGSGVGWFARDLDWKSLIFGDRHQQPRA